MRDPGRRIGEIAAGFEKGQIKIALVERWDGAGAGFASLARIALFAGVWLVVLGLVIPTPMPAAGELAVNVEDVTPDEIVRSVTLDRRDERGFLEVDRSGRMRVAWIAGSTVKELADDASYRFIPGILADRIQLADGGMVDVDLYFLQAGRVVDTYLATLEAIETDPDVVVVALNPALVYNGAAVQTWDNFDGLLASHTLNRLDLLPLTTALVSPSDVAWGLVGKRFELIEDRWHLGNRLGARPTVGDLLQTDIESSRTERTTFDRIRSMNLPVDFWIADGDFEPRATTLDRQLALLQTAAAFDDRLNEAVLRLLGRAISESGIPTVVYVPPVRRTVEQAPWLADHLEGIESRLSALAPAFEGDRVHFSAAPLGLPEADLAFVDLLHVGNGVPVADEIAARMCSVLTGTTAVCITEEGSG